MDQLSRYGPRQHRDFTREKAALEQQCLISGHSTVSNPTRLTQPEMAFHVLNQQHT
jgi:hypothetical protein